MGNLVFRPSSISRVHCYESRARLYELNLPAFEDEPLRLHRFRISDRDELLRNHRQNLNVDSVELVEAAPGAALSETGEESSHHFVVETVGAVEDDALNSECFGEIFCGFSFTGARGTNEKTILSLIASNQGY